MKTQPNEQLLNEQERRAWDAIAEAAREILKLPEIHPAERSEAVPHIHALQTSILARVAYDPELR